MRYIKELTEEEVTQLQLGHKNGSSSRFRDRCQAILLSHQGYSINKLSDLFGVRRDTISNWLSRWESEKFKGLEDKAKSGRPKCLSLDNEQHVQKVKSLLKKEQQKLAIVLAQIEGDLGISMSKKTLQRFLKSLVLDGDVIDYVSKNDKNQKNMKLN
jgi:transposase